MIKITCDKCSLTLDLSGKGLMKDEHGSVSINYEMDKFKETFPGAPYIDGKYIILCSEHAKEFSDKNTKAEVDKQKELRAWLVSQNQ